MATWRQKLELTLRYHLKSNCHKYFSQQASYIKLIISIFLIYGVVPVWHTLLAVVTVQCEESLEWAPVFSYNLLR